MKTVETNVYSFDELSTEAQEFALNKRYQNSYWPCTDDTNDVLSAFEQIFDVSVDVVGGYNAYDNTFILRTNFEYDELDFTGIRLMKYLCNNYLRYIEQPVIRYSKNYWNNGYKKYYSKVFSTTDGYPLTGYFLDNVILQPILDFIKSPNNTTTFKNLLCKCVRKFLEAAQDDFDSYYSKEYAIDDYNNRGSLFFEDGSVYDLDPMN